MEGQDKIYITPMPIRIWHWVNALAIVTLCATGAQIRFPEWINLFGPYKGAIRLHNTAGVVASGSFLIWLGYYLFVGRNLLRLYLPTINDVRTGFVRQAVFYVYYYFKGGKNPHVTSPDNKFNPLQKASYLVMMLFLLPVTIVTGVLLFRVEPIQSLLGVAGGIRLVTGLHYLLASIFTAFLFVHAYLATLGRTPLEHFKPMWTGWEEVHRRVPGAAEGAE